MGAFSELQESLQNYKPVKTTKKENEMEQNQLKINKIEQELKARNERVANYQNSIKEFKITARIPYKMFGYFEVEFLVDGPGYNEAIMFVKKEIAKHSDIGERPAAKSSMPTRSNQGYNKPRFQQGPQINGMAYYASGKPVRSKDALSIETNLYEAYRDFVDFKQDPIWNHTKKEIIDIVKRSSVPQAEPGPWDTDQSF